MGSNMINSSRIRRIEEKPPDFCLKLYLNGSIVRLSTLATVSLLIAILAWLKHFRKVKKVTGWSEVGRVSSLRVYPLKSGKGVACESLACEPEGPRLDHSRDRMFLVIASDGRFVSGREYPKMTQIASEVSADKLRLSAPGTTGLEVEIPRGGKFVRLRIWKAPAEGLDCGDEVSKWLTEYLESANTLRLLYRDEKIGKKDYIPDIKALLDATGTKTQKSDTGLFSDTFSYHLVSESSVADLNRRIKDQTVTPQHFRPNIVVSGDGLVPYEEDGWHLVKINDVIFQFLAPCMRCSFTKIDPATGVISNDEPLKTLKKYRFVSDQEVRRFVYTPTMGIYLGLRGKGNISVGDPVSVALIDP